MTRGALLYLDTSAAAKLLVAEPERPPLMVRLATAEALVSSELLVVELLRVGARLGGQGPRLARELLRDVVMLPLTRPILERAGALQPPALRSLDAIHVAAALALGARLDAVVTYDERQAAAARAHRLRVESPS